MTGISIIIPTLNRTTFLKETLDNLLVQEFEYPFEILIVDQSVKPDDLIINYIKGQPIVRYHHITQFRGLPEARNFGWQHAKYDYVLYVDDDIRCGPTLLIEHYKYLAYDSTIGVVAGGITEAFKENLNCEVGRFIASTATPLRGFHKKGAFEVDHGGGGNFSVKKEVLKTVNGIDEFLTKGAALYEETDLCLRIKSAGYKIFFNSEAHVVHLAASTGGCRVENIDKYMYSLVRNRSLMIARHTKGLNKVTAQLYLFKLLIAYVWSYKRLSLFSVYFIAKEEGKKVGRQPVKCTIWDER